LIPGRSYLLKLHTSQAVATVTAIKYVMDVKSGHHLAAKRIEMNDIGVVNISTDRLLPFENYTANRRLGSFILVDRHNNQTVGAGMIDFSLRRADNIHWQPFKVDKDARARQKLQSPACIWFTGLSGSGKSTIANMLEQRLFSAGKHTYLLDGDNIRHGLNRDLGFTEADRVENLRRTAEVARLLVDAGMIVIVSLISPFESERELARSRFEPGEFVEVFVDTPIEECERRDVKGLYAKAHRGELINFTGVDSPYEPPKNPEVHLETIKESPAASVDRILEKLRAGGAW
jgi:bifunctional enzyme CysN/CysC